jgi:hypothetical protein
MSASTTERVIENTAPQYNQDILHITENRIRYYAKHPEEIDQRLAQLNEEWDVERVLEANASALALGGIALSVFHKKYLFFSAAVLGFLHLHAQQGWCPPLPILRRAGVRTQTEIEYERYALKLLRGDFVGTTRGGKRMVEDVLSSALPSPLSDER